MRRVLTTKQLGRLRQVARQLRGTGAFREPEVAAALKLTAEQRERIRAIDEETFGGPPRGKMRPGAPMEDLRKAHEQRVRAAVERILALLTSEQGRRWQEMTGEPFKGPMPFLPFGPFGPPR